MHVSNPPELATTVAGLLKAAKEEWYACLQPSGVRLSSPRKPQSDLALTSIGKSSRLSGWTAKRQTKNKNFTLDSSVAIIVDTKLHPRHPALTASQARTLSSPSPTPLPNDLASPPPSPASSAPTSITATPATTQPRPFTLTPSPPCLDPSRPTYPSPVTLAPPPP